MRADWKRVVDTVLAAFDQGRSPVTQVSGPELVSRVNEDTPITYTTGLPADHQESARVTHSLIAMLNDGELDQFEVGAVRKAIAHLLGTSEHELPSDIEGWLDTALPAANMPVEHYGLSLDLRTPGAPHPAQVTVTFEAPSTGPIILEANDARIDVTNVRVGGARVPFTFENNRLIIDAPVGTRVVDIDYLLTATEERVSRPFIFFSPILMEHVGHGLVHDTRVDAYFTLTAFGHAPDLLPSNPDPGDRVAATVEVKPAPGSRFIGPTGEEGTRFEMPVEAPLQSIAIAGGPTLNVTPPVTTPSGYEIRGATFWNPAHYESEWLTSLGAARHAVEYFHALLGGGPSRNLTLTFLDGSYGGIEHVGIPAMMTPAFSSPGRPRIPWLTAAHEVAHQWVGNAVQFASWRDTWLKEGLTEYLAFRFGEYAASNDIQFREPRYAADEVSVEEGVVDEYMLETARETLDGATRFPRPLHTPEALTPEEHFATAYPYGLWLVRMIETHPRIGRAKFDQALKSWFEASRGKVVTADDFLAHVSASTGVNVKRFIHEWLDTPPTTLKLANRIRGEGNTVWIEVLTPRDELPPKGTLIPIELVSADGESVTFNIDPHRPRHTLRAPFEVARFRWDPTFTTLATMKDYLFQDGDATGFFLDELGLRVLTRDWRTSSP